MELKEESEGNKYYLPLEFVDEEERKEASLLFSKLLNMHGVRGGGICSTTKIVAKARKSAIIVLARHLLGEDFSYEELC